MQEKRYQNGERKYLSNNLQNFICRKLWTGLRKDQLLKRFHNGFLWFKKSENYRESNFFNKLLFQQDLNRKSILDGNKPFRIR